MNVRGAPLPLALLLLLAIATAVTGYNTPPLTRRSLLNIASSAASVGALSPLAAHADVGQILKAASDSSMITYSSNARNFARLGEGDQSAGSKYQNRDTLRYTFIGALVGVV